MKIVLIGYMGSGKTTIGKHLAQDLGYSFLDLDTYIEQQLNTTISKLFENKGEIYFRKKEHDYLKEVLAREGNLVIATGGGAPCYSGNVDVMLSQTKNVFYLKVSISELLNRLHKEKATRPLIKDLEDKDLPEFIGKHLFERNSYYTLANHTIVCDSKDIATIAAEIRAFLV